MDVSMDGRIYGSMDLRMDVSMDGWIDETMDF
jgi:hypothetical protein